MLMVYESAFDKFFDERSEEHRSELNGRSTKLLLHELEKLVPVSWKTLLFEKSGAWYFIIDHIRKINDIAGYSSLFCCLLL